MDGSGKIGFDERGQRVPVTDFDHDAVDPEIQNLKAALDYAKTKLPELLDLVFEILLSENLTAKQLQNRVYFFAFIVGKLPFATQAELAAHLKISPAGVSQALNTLCSKFPLLARLRAD